MCLACLEYIKGNLNLKELKSALREFGQQADTKDHADKVQTIFYDHTGSEEDLKKKIQSLLK